MRFQKFTEKYEILSNLKRFMDELKDLVQVYSYRTLVHFIQSLTKSNLERAQSSVLRRYPLPKFGQKLLKIFQHPHLILAPNLLIFAGTHWPSYLEHKYLGFPMSGTAVHYCWLAYWTTAGLLLSDASGQGGILPSANYAVENPQKLLVAQHANCRKTIRPSCELRPAVPVSGAAAAPLGT